jgi:ketosteroid isomerase-like protein
MSAPSAVLRAEVESLLADWAHAVDSGQAESAIVHYAEAAEQHLPHGSAIGREAVAAGLARRQAMTERRTRHVFTNLRVVQEGQDVVAHTVLTLYRSDTADRSPCAEMVADLTDRYQRGADGRLRIVHRRVVPVFQ